MSRSRWTDYLNDHLFWAMDISANKSFPVFTPLFGFSAISAPKIQAEVESFKDGTYNYPRHIIKGGTIPQITFRRAASLYDSDFYDWMYLAIEGSNAGKNFTGKLASVGSFLAPLSGRVRRNLVIFHFSRINLAGGANDDSASGLAVGAIQGALIGAAFGGGGVGSAQGAVVGAAVGAGAAGVGFSVGPFAFASWLPARAWILYDCIPVAYSSGSDFDAASGNVSLMELTVQPEWIEEFSFGLRP